MRRIMETFRSPQREEYIQDRLSEELEDIERDNQNADIARAIMDIEDMKCNFREIAYNIREIGSANFGWSDRDYMVALIDALYNSLKDTSTYLSQD